MQIIWIQKLYALLEEAERDNTLSDDLRERIISGLENLIGGVSRHDETVSDESSNGSHDFGYG